MHRPRPRIASRGAENERRKARRTSIKREEAEIEKHKERQAIERTTGNLFESTVESGARDLSLYFQWHHHHHHTTDARDCRCVQYKYMTGIAVLVTQKTDKTTKIREDDFVGGEGRDAKIEALHAIRCCSLHSLSLSKNMLVVDADP